jgi:hypothetical protein
MLAYLLISSAWGEPPERPEPPPVIEGECPYTIGLDVGNQVPAVLAAEVINCSAVAVPLSEYQDLLLTEEWAESLHMYTVLDNELRNQELNWYIAQLEVAQTPEPFWSRTGTMIGVGVLSGAACVLASAWAIQQVSQ